jgi:hypothetical protein
VVIFTLKQKEKVSFVAFYCREGKKERGSLGWRDRRNMSWTKVFISLLISSISLPVCRASLQPFSVVIAYSTDNHILFFFVHDDHVWNETQEEEGRTTRGTQSTKNNERILGSETCFFCHVL